MTDIEIAELAIKRLTMLTEKEITECHVPKIPEKLMDYLSKVIPLYVLIELKKIQGKIEEKENG